MEDELKLDKSDFEILVNNSKNIRDTLANIIDNENNFDTDFKIKLDNNGEEIILKAIVSKIEKASGDINYYMRLRK